jgi:hypothetical protein
MTIHTHVDVARSDVVGSLLRPPYLRETRQGVHQGRVSAAALHAVEDRAVRSAGGRCGAERALCRPISTRAGRSARRVAA